MLLCGRSRLLHRDMGDGNPSCPASIYLDGTILLYMKAWEMGGPPRLGPGYLLGVGAGRGQRLVPLHAIPRRGRVEARKLVPVGIASL